MSGPILPPKGLAVFDLDGTLTRGETCVQVIASVIGRRAECDEFEKLAPMDRSDLGKARTQMAAWLASSDRQAISRAIDLMPLAPGAEECFARLREVGVATGIVSITWQFAVLRFALRLGADFFVGTELQSTGEVRHFWPEDKATWTDSLARWLGLPLNRVAGVGDSLHDHAFLAIVGHPFYVGTDDPPDRAQHLAGADLDKVADMIVGAFA